MPQDVAEGTRNPADVGHDGTVRLTRRVEEWNYGMVITGRYDHVIDDKGRLAIPSQIRNAMVPSATARGSTWYREARWHLQLIPERLFEQLASSAPAGLLPSAEVAKARRFVYSMSTKVDPDKQGRVIIPDGFMQDSPSGSPGADDVEPRSDVGRQRRSHRDMES